jgi:cysteine desulfurase
MDSIYLDHNATTPMRPEVVETVARAMAENYANPASQHQPGQRARRVLEDARERIAEILGANLSGTAPDRLIFTSGGTEANNLAILGIVRGSHPQQQGHVVISAAEHPSVIEPAEHLLKAGWELDALGVDEHGVIRSERLAGLLTPQTRLVSVLLGNHDTGVVQPIATVVKICSAANVPVHTDAVQAIGKLPVNFRALGVASMSVGAHKFQGPPGIGGLLVRHETSLEPILYGGSQQLGARPGTEPVALVLGMLKALECWLPERQDHCVRLEKLRKRFESGLQAGYAGLVVNGAGAPRLPNTSNIAFTGLDGQVLLMAMDLAGVACSVGSACSSGSTELSPTLLAMGLPKSIVGSSLRFSLGATTTAAEIDEAIHRILQVCHELRGD